MPADSSPTRSRWSLKSMLGRKGSSSKDKNGSSNSNSSSSSSKKKIHQKCTCKSQEEQECSVASIKERVLAKLKEPLPGELRQAARRSLDSSLPFTPPLTRTPHPISSSHRKKAAAESETSHRLHQHRFSASSSYWPSESDTLSSYQASVKDVPPSVSGNSYYSSHHGPWSSRSSCSSPTSNVIARLMGLSDASHIHPTLLSEHRRKQSSASNPWLELSPRGGSLHTQCRQDISKRDRAQDFLDEMEDHLKQCDKALERIEAVMQLKKKLLILNNNRTMTSRSSELLHYNTAPMDRRRDVAYNNTAPRNTAKHVRTGSVDQIITQRREKDQAAQAQQQRRYRHRRSVSDGETPVFRLPNDIELDNCNDSFRKWHAVEPLLEKTKHAIRRVPTQSSPPRTPTQISHLEEHIVAPDGSNGEQPSPVSVLDSHPPDDSTSEDDPADLHKENVGAASAEQAAKPKKKSVVRALWGAPAAATEAAVVGKQGAALAPSKKQTKNTGETSTVEDWEVVKRIERGWAAARKAEVAEVGAEVEKLIFRRLLEETMIHVASCCRR